MNTSVVSIRHNLALLFIFIFFEDKLRKERASIPIVADSLQDFERQPEYWLSAIIESSYDVSLT